MKRVGIIGGIGPESTIDYYRLFISTYRGRIKDGSYPSVLINSIDMKKMLDFIGAKQFTEVTGYLLEEIKKLSNAGAELGLIASNTPHIVFDRIKEQTSIPLISIVEAAGENAKLFDLKKAGLLGTMFTMQGGFYEKVFAKNNIELITPDIKEQEYIHNKYMNELVNGIFSDDTKKHFLSIVDNMINEHNIDCLILGGTELPLLLKDKYYRGIKLLDTTRIHVEAAVTKMLNLP